MNTHPSEDEINEEENELNDENDFEGEIVEEHLGSRRRRKKKIKIKKRVKIKRKSSPKKRVKKTIETVLWVLVVAAFVTTLIILILQLDLNTKNKKIRTVGKNEVTTQQGQPMNGIRNVKHFLL
ncbi:MAG: hypothetical protein ACKOX3_04960 [Bacteroidota bacterium]